MKTPTPTGSGADAAAPVARPPAPMRFTYRLVGDASGWLAECEEPEAMGEGRTQAEAVEALRKALEERMMRPDAVAPPSMKPANAGIELVLGLLHEPSS